MDNHEKQRSAQMFIPLATLIIVLSTFIACSENSGNNASDEMLNESSLSSASQDSLNYSGVIYKTFEGLAAEQPCDLAMNKTVAHVSSTNQDYLCSQDASTGIWSWVPYQGGNGTIIDENGRVYETFVDSRDGHIYKMVTIGTQTWMAENLAFATDSSHCMLDDGVVEYCGYGRYYRWSDAIDTAGRFSTDGVGCGVGSYAKDCPAIWSKNSIRGVCPQGWHLPDTSEWRTLFDFVRTPSALLKQGLSSSYLDNGTDAYGFSAFPVGYWYQGSCSNCSKSIGGSSGSYSVIYHASTPIYHYDNLSLMHIPDVNWDGNKFNVGWSEYFTKNGLLPVRCVKNIEENTYSSSSQYSNGETAFSSSSTPTSSLYLANSVPNSCTGKVSWHGPDKIYRVDTQHDDGSETSGYWYAYSDVVEGGNSYIKGPNYNSRNDPSYPSALIDYCGGVCGSYTLEGNLPYGQYAVVGFNITGGSLSPANVSDWGGICITYVSDIDFFIMEKVDNLVDALYYSPLASLPRSSTPTTKKIPWSSFTLPWYATGSVVTGQDAAKKLIGINIEFMDYTYASGNFNIITIGSYY